MELQFKYQDLSIKWKEQQRAHHDDKKSVCVTWLYVAALCRCPVRKSSELSAGACKNWLRMERNAVPQYERWQLWAKLEQQELRVEEVRPMPWALITPGAQISTATAAATAAATE